MRIVRYLSIGFALLSFVWWTILLVASFVTPPGFHTRGSGFFTFSYSSLALANLLFTLVFFAIPSKAVRILSIIMGGMLLIDVILLLSVEKTRHEESWVGMVSVLCKSEIREMSTLPEPTLTDYRGSSNGNVDTGHRSPGRVGQERRRGTVDGPSRN